MEKINKIYGPPGTGKTFRLIRRVKAYQRKGVPLHKIGYFAFTKKAAQEARERIGVSEKKVTYFQTIHAFCYHLLGLKEHCDQIYLAGDDDQAIYAWAGADVNRFIKEPGKERVLRRSRRVSKSVQEQSTIPVSRISGIRKQKNYLPRNYKGECQHISDLNQIDLSKGKWLILTRTKSNLLDIMKDLKRKNFYYQSNKGKSFKVGMYEAAAAYTKWTMNELLNEKEISAVKEYIPNGSWNVNTPWYDIFIADQKEILYLRNLIASKENLKEKARIWLSTIHAIKGGEEDNVILSLHQGRTVQQGIKLSVDKQDEEHRVWYVGITRARNNLYKLRAKKKLKEYKL